MQGMRNTANLAPMEALYKASDFDCYDRSLWDPLESFFEEQGYCLFVLESQQFDVPKNPTEIRTPDPYHVFIGEPLPSRFRCIVRYCLCVQRNIRPSDSTCSCDSATSFAPPLAFQTELTSYYSSLQLVKMD